VTNDRAIAEGLLETARGLGETTPLLAEPAGARWAGRRRCRHRLELPAEG